jgi:hypothetical protein
MVMIPLTKVLSDPADSLGRTGKLFLHMCLAYGKINCTFRVKRSVFSGFRCSSSCYLAIQIIILVAYYKSILPRKLRNKVNGDRRRNKIQR